MIRRNFAVDVLLADSVENSHSLFRAIIGSVGPQVRVICIPVGSIGFPFAIPIQQITSAFFIIYPLIRLRLLSATAGAAARTTGATRAGRAAGAGASATGGLGRGPGAGTTASRAAASRLGCGTRTRISGPRRGLAGRSAAAGMLTRAFSLISVLFLIAGRSVIGVGRFNYLAVGFTYHKVTQGIIADQSRNPASPFRAAS